MQHTTKHIGRRSITRSARPVTHNARPIKQPIGRPSAAGNGNGAINGITTIHRLLIRENGVLLVPGAYDALSAKSLEQAGHKAAFVSGAAVSAALLGQPDLGLLTAPEMARKAGQIVSACPSLPVIADADTGGGSVLNVQRTVRQLITAGCKGCILEDQVWPKAAGHRKKEVVPMEEFASKIAAAREAIGDADFFLIARTDARGASAKHGLEDGINRVNLYVDAGADGSFVEGPRSDEELKLIGKSTKGLRVCDMLEGGITPLRTPMELKEMGFHIVTYPLSGLLAATKAMSKVYGALAWKGTTRDDLASITKFSEFNQMMGLDAAIATEELLTRREAGDKLSVRVRAPVKPVS